MWEAIDHTQVVPNTPSPLKDFFFTVDYEVQPRM